MAKHTNRITRSTNILWLTVILQAANLQAVILQSNNHRSSLNLQVEDRKPIENFT